jgi:hypothetical protein
VAQRKADQFFEALKLKSGDRVLLIIDDTYVEKKRNHTDGVWEIFSITAKVTSVVITLSPQYCSPKAFSFRIS